MPSLQPAAFNQLLNHLGQQFAWQKAYACPCINPHSGQAKQNCQVCQGKTRYWGSAVSGKAAVVGREQAKRQAEFGLWEAGDLMLSIPSDSPLYDIGLYDKVAALNRTEPFSTTAVSGDNTVFRFAITSIDSIIWLDANQQIVQGAIPIIGANGQIIWGANQPPPNTSYAVTGRKTPDYFCYNDLPIDRPHHAGGALPRRIQLKRFDLFSL